MYDNFHGIKHPIVRGLKLASTSYDMFELHMQTGKYEIEMGKDRKVGQGKAGEWLPESKTGKTEEWFQESKTGEQFK
jgi:hypothetical protein